MTMDDIPVDVASFREHGYLHIKCAFSVDEVARYRACLLDKFDMGDANAQATQDMLCDPDTADFILDPRIISMARQLLGQKPVYFGDSSAVMYQSNNDVCTLHKDNADRHDPDAPDWHGDYPILRVALYLQDHSRHSGGLVLHAGSHKSVKRNRKLEVLNEEVLGWLTGRTRYVPTETGDLVVWNLRTTHGGMGRYIRGPIRRPITERTQPFFPKFLQSKMSKTRLAMFASYGAEGNHLERYLANLKTRKYMVEMWRAARYKPDQFAAMEKLGAKLMDMRGEIEADTAAGQIIGQYTKWRALPY